MADVVKVTNIAFLSLGGGDVRLREAADIIAEAAKENAAWSRKIPPSISTRVEGNTAIVAADAPNARPAELRLRHPLFGDREHWYGPPGEPFLAPAVDERIDEAVRKYAEKFDDYAHKLGYR